MDGAHAFHKPSDGTMMNTIRTPENSFRMSLILPDFAGCAGFQGFVPV
jgi:hypothetical protein